MYAVKLLQLIFLSLLSLSLWAQDSENVQVVGVGGSFPAPLYARWIQEFERIHSEFHFRYMPSGSSQGVEMVGSGQSDFAATDAPMTDQQLARTKVRVLHFPAVVGAVVPIYNLPGVKQVLRFTPKALAGIYLGTIREWNAPEIAQANPGLPLPATKIIVTHSADGRGTTYVWTDYLSKVSGEWKTRVGRGTVVEWPVGGTAEGSGNMAKLVGQTPNSFGFVELTYALLNNVPFGEVRNAAGNFVRADTASVRDAEKSTGAESGNDFRISLTNAPGKNSYPIASYTWLLIPETIPDSGKRRAIKEFLQWMLTEGQGYAGPLGFCPLSPALAQAARTAIRTIH